MSLLRVIYLLTFASGALALTYELLWMRRFTAVFGASTPAVAATLAAMFLGMGIGSAVVGRYAPQSRHFLRHYAYLEFGIALGALLVEPSTRWYEAVGASSVWTKTLFALAALFLPSFFMGGTLPLLGQALAAESRRLGVKVSGLYAANLLGATAGALSVPFLWLPNLTARASYFTCVLLSFVLGVAAFLLNSRHPPLSPQDRGSRLADMPLPWAVLLSFAALSGAALFALQVLWSRMFSQVHENSIFSFSLVLAVVLGALGVSSGVARFLLARGWPARRLLALGWMLSGLFVSFAPVIFFHQTGGLSLIEGSWGGNASYALKLLFLLLPAVFLPAFFAGLALPALLEIAGVSTSMASGKALGLFFAANTAGSVLACLVTALLLPYWVGLWTGFFALGALLLIAAGVCFKPAYLVVSLLIAIVSFAVSDPRALPRVKYRPQEGEKVLEVRESSHGIIAVLDKAGSRRLKLNNSYVLGGTASSGDERLQAHIPLLLHPSPKHVAFLGFGTGITAGAALLHPIEQLAAVELVPEVIEVAAQHFAQENLNVVRAPRARIIADDARSFLRAGTNTFDVIVGDLFVPWHQGEALLFTADQFEAARRRLAPGGLFCQWLPMFQLSEQEFNIVAATFLDVFPRTTLWRGDFSPRQPALALIGHSPDAPLDPASVERRVREMSPDPANPMLSHPAGLWIFCVGALNPQMAQFARARRHRENQPWLELLGPLNRPTSKGSAGFVGAALLQFLSTVQSLPTTDSPLSRMSDEQGHWRQAGAGIAQAAVLLGAGRSQDGARLVEASISALPPELQRAFSGQ